MLSIDFQQHVCSRHLRHSHLFLVLLGHAVASNDVHNAARGSVVLRTRDSWLPFATGGCEDESPVVDSTVAPAAPYSATATASLPFTAETHPVVHTEVPAFGESTHFLS